MQDIFLLKYAKTFLQSKKRTIFAAQSEYYQKPKTNYIN